jgi:hypothetical protein
MTEPANRDAATPRGGCGEKPRTPNATMPAYTTDAKKNKAMPPDRRLVATSG